MKEPLLAEKELELDLSFDGGILDLLDDDIDQALKNILIKAELWEKLLKNWINYIRVTPIFSCPKVVRISSSVSMGLKFTDDETIAALNASWRQKSEKTDVLSFPVIDDEIDFPRDQSVELGDIVVSIKMAEQQAKEQGHSLEKELLWLVSHGLLHLLGWTHATKQRLNEMLGCQEQLLSIDGNLQTHVVKT